MTFYTKSVSILATCEYVSKDLSTLVTSNNELFNNSQPQVAIFKGTG
jgi:hypothetical protein